MPTITSVSMAKVISFSLCVAACPALATVSDAALGVIVDFEQFDVGDDLATVNAGLAPLGITFDAAFPSTFEVVLEAGGSGNKAVRAMPFGAAGAVDIVANFAYPVASLSVEFVANPDPPGFLSLEAYGAHQNAGGLDISQFLFEAHAFSSTGTLQLTWSDVFDPPPQIRAATMGVARGGTLAFNDIDNRGGAVVPAP